MVPFFAISPGVVVKTLFQHDSQLTAGEVEVKLLPGIPILHVVGQPDAAIRECGLKLKSALRTCGLAWPKGHQIVVNLRPAHFRKTSAGVELAVALGFLALTNQLPEAIRRQLGTAVVYGELALNGDAYAPPDLQRALRAAGAPLITGEAVSEIRDGDWLKLATLDSPDLVPVQRRFPWESFWRTPQFPDLELAPEAYAALIVSAHMGLNVLVAGPQGSGKTTWAKALYALTPLPERKYMGELYDLFGEQVLRSRWRPCEAPHHSVTPLAMVGGGSPLVPGVISRAHGGLLIMDEFLEFDSHVLEALREPIETGYVEHARRGERTRFVAKFQLVGTANLCPCGKLYPKRKVKCGLTLFRCRSVCDRLSGPIMDRFDILLYSHTWLKKGPRRRWSEAQAEVRRLADFALTRGDFKEEIPPWISDLEISHRRGRAVLRLARGMADLEGSKIIQPHHYGEAYRNVVKPMDALKKLFA